jgi:hypothetical protein
MSLYNVLNGEAAYYESQAARARGSDAKKYRALADITREHAIRVNEAVIDAFIEPFLKNATPSIAHDWIAAAGEGCLSEFLRDAFIENLEACSDVMSVLKSFFESVPWTILATRIRDLADTEK